MVQSAAGNEMTSQEVRRCGVMPVWLFPRSRFSHCKAAWTVTDCPHGWNDEVTTHSRTQAAAAAKILRGWYMSLKQLFAIGYGGCWTQAYTVHDTLPDCNHAVENVEYCRQWWRSWRS